jgi:hypothetical protein
MLTPAQALALYGQVRAATIDMGLAATIGPLLPFLVDPFAALRMNALLWAMWTQPRR